MQRITSTSRSVAGICVAICYIAGLGTVLSPQLLAQTLPLPGALAARAPGTTTQLSIATEEGDTRTQAVFTAHVMGVETSATPQGIVTLKLGEHSLGSAILDENGFATYTAAAMPEGRQQVLATYEGSANFAPSTSPARVLDSLASSLPDFTIAPAGPTALTIKAGQFATTSFLLTPENGFNQIVSYSCSGLPLAAICTFTPDQVLPDGKNTPVSTILEIQTVAITGGKAMATPSGIRPIFALLLPGLLALAGLGSARRHLPGIRLLSIAALLIVSGVGLGACSAQYSYYHHPPTLNKGTPAGVNTVIVYASSSTGTVALERTQQIILTVTN